MKIEDAIAIIKSQGDRFPSQAEWRRVSEACSALLPRENESANDETEKPMKVYISLPISDKDIDMVRYEISDASNIISQRGWLPVSPLDGLTNYCGKWIDYIVKDLKTLGECDAICIVKHHRGDKEDFSEGMLIEKLAAAKMGLVGFYYYIDNRTIEPIIEHGFDFSKSMMMLKTLK